jgi:hypothetical protein
MKAEERKRKEDLLKRMHIAIINGKLEDYCRLPDDQKPAFEVKLTKLCFRYNNLKKELGI